MIDKHELNRLLMQSNGMIAEGGPKKSCVAATKVMCSRISWGMVLSEGRARIEAETQMIVVEGQHQALRPAKLELREH